MTDLFQPGPAIQSLRESDFDANSAYGEVVDNSLQAGASNIRIVFKLDIRGGNRRKNLSCVAFGDDGCGMSSETLHNCLTIGWSSRFNDRDGIGRFGVGMTLGAIHECKRIKVWSKLRGGEWLYTYVDLDEIASGSMKGIPPPTPVRIPEQFMALVGHESGTLVVWEKYDRQTEDGERLRDKFRVWAGRTYRYFIWGEVPNRSGAVTLSIDGAPVPAIDPLYWRNKLTPFPDDPRATCYEPIKLSWPVDPELVRDGRPSESQITIQFSLLPAEWRQRPGDGGSESMRKRHVPENEGISILRNYREVFYGHIPYWNVGGKGWASFEDKDRWWGCEIHFQPELDRAFQTKHIKRGSVPVTELKELIKSQLLPSRNSAIEAVDKHWEEVRLREKTLREAEKARQLVALPGEHGLAERVASKAAVPENQLDKEKDRVAESKAVADSYDEYDAAQKQHLVELFKNQPFTIVEKTWNGPQFYEAKFLGGTIVLEYNNSHVFWKRLDMLMQKLSSQQEDHAAVAREIRTMMDILIIGHAKGEVMFSPEVQYTAGEFVDQARMNWGQYLKSYIIARERMTDE